MQPVKYAPVFFAPDMDPSWVKNPGILVDVSNMLPTNRGSLISYACNATTFSTTFSETTYGKPLIGAVLKKVDGSGRLIVGTTTRLMECPDLSSAWVDRSQGGTDYTTSTDFKYNYEWDFTTYGNDLIAVSKKNNPQVINAGSAFADLGGTPPKAACCATNKNFVLLGNCNDGVNDLGDQIWWSGLGNDATWTPDAATQAGNYRLRDSPGHVTALVNMRDWVIAYKDDSIYVGQYEGSPLLWTWRLITDEVGCSSAHGVAVLGGVHYFLHRSGVYRFDGASVQNLGLLVNKYLFSKLSQDKFATAHAAYDEYSGCILWYFGDPNTSTIYERRRALAYHPGAQSFGYVNDAWESDTHQAIIKGSLSDLYAFNSSFKSQAHNILTIGSVSGSATIRIPNFGIATTSTMSVTTGHIGDEIQTTNLTMIKPRLVSAGGDTATLSDTTVYGRMSEHNSDDAGTTFVADNTRSRWNGSKSARWLRATLTFTNGCEIAGLYLTSAQAGLE